MPLAAASAALFAAAHHVGPFGEAFDGYVFLFRSLAGLYFALLYQFRGNPAPSLAGSVPGPDLGQQHLGLSGGQTLLGAARDQLRQRLLGGEARWGDTR